MSAPTAAKPTRKLDFNIVGFSKPFLMARGDGQPNALFCTAYAEWKHTDGPFTDTHLIPKYTWGAKDPWHYEEEEHQKRDVVKDSVNVLHSDVEADMVAAATVVLNLKREQLAANLKVAP